jgi:tetratricopeptide (TPR) repeat protein
MALNFQEKTWRRLAWSCEAVLIGVVVAVSGAMAHEHLKHWNGPALSISNDLYIPALMWAHGRGFHNANPDEAPGLRAFLDFQTQSFPREALPPDLLPQPLDTYQQYHQYLIFTVGLAWRCFGVSWDVVRGLCIVFFCLMTLATYGLLRMAGGPWLAAPATAAAMYYGSGLVFVNYLRDFSKAPFILATMLLSAWLIRRPATLRRYVLGALLFGVTIGVGLGFRRDLAVFVPVAILVLLACPLAVPRRAWMYRIGAVALLGLTFFVVSAPILRSFQEKGTLGDHDLLMGMTTYCDDQLALGRASYERLYQINDTFVSRTAFETARRSIQAFDYLYPEMPESETAKRDLLVRFARMFPGDMIVRAYAAVLQALHGVPAWPSTQHAGFVFMAAAAFAIMAAYQPCTALLALFLLLYCAGVTSLQYSQRHAFHLAFLGYWPGLFLANHALRLVLPSQRRRYAQLLKHPRFGWKAPLARAVLAPIAVLLVLASAVGAARLVQAHSVRSLMHTVQSAPTEVIPTIERRWDQWVLFQPKFPLASRFMMAPTQSSPVVQASYVMAEFEPGAGPCCFWIHYESGDPSADFSNVIDGSPFATGGASPNRYYFPVYEQSAVHEWNRFRGIILRKENAQRFRGLYYVVGAEVWPLWLNLAVPGAPVAPRTHLTLIPGSQPPGDVCIADTFNGVPDPPLDFHLLRSANACGDPKMEKMCRDMIEREPWNLEARLVLGRCLEGERRAEEADAIYQAGVIENPEDSLLLQRFDECLRGRLDAPGCVERWRALAEAQPESAGIAWYYGLALRERGDWAGAEQAFRKAIGLQPRWAFTHTGYLDVLLQRMDVDAALRQIEADAGTSLNDSIARKSLARLCVNEALYLAKNSQEDRALALYASAHGYDDRCESAYRLEGDLYQARRDFANAVKAYQESLRCRPFDVSLCFILDGCYAQMNAPEARLKTWRDHVQRHPAWGPGYLFLGIALNRAQQPAAAEQAWRTAMRLAPDFSPIRTMLAQDSIARNEYRKALRILEANPDRDSNDHAILIKRVDAYLGLGDVTTVKRLLEQCHRLNCAIPKDLAEKLQRRGLTP